MEAKRRREEERQKHVQAERQLKEQEEAARKLQVSSTSSDHCSDCLLALPFFL